MNMQSDLAREVNATVNQGMEIWNVPGLSLAIIKGDDVLLSSGFGFREVGKPEKVDEHTLFSIGSNTKAFTATAIGLLVQEGKLDWDEPVTNYLPSFRLYDPCATQLITIRDLLCHRAGLGTWSGDMLQLSSYSIEEIVHRIRYIPPAYGFRAGYGYCNLLYITAGLVILKITGGSWDDFIRERIFEPLGMKNSVTSPLYFNERTNIATPHEEIKGKLQTVNYRKDNQFSAAGSICSSISDIIRWMQVQLNNGKLDGKQIIDESIINEMRVPHTFIPIKPVERKLFPSRRFSAYGLGWFLNETNGRFIFRHTGGVDGMLSNIVMIPDEKVGIAIFTNKLPNAAYLLLAHHLTEKLLGLPSSRDWIQTYVDLEKDANNAAESKMKQRDSQVKDVKLSFELVHYSGEYESDILGEAIISVKGTGLRIQLKAHETLSGELEHWHYDMFLCRWDDPVLGESLIPFIGDGQGNVTEFRVRIREDWIDPLEHIFRKK